jgi:glycosyltransferase involved in cell wall biosynthesis
VFDRLVFFTSLPNVGGHTTISVELVRLLRPLFKNITLITREMPGHGTSEGAINTLRRLDTNIVKLSGGRLVSDLRKVLVDHHLCLGRPDIFLAMGMRHLSPILSVISRAERSFYYHITHELDSRTIRQLSLYSRFFSSLLFISPATEVEWAALGRKTIPTWSLLQPVGDADQVVRRKAADDRTSLGFIGRLNEGKGSQLLLDFAETCPVPCRLRVAGSGEFAGRFEALAKRSELQVKVRFDGPFTPEDRTRYLEDFFGDIDYLLVPSQDDREGIPTVILESLRAGVPVIATATGGMKAFENASFGDSACVRLTSRDSFMTELGFLSKQTAPTQSKRDACRDLFVRRFSDQAAFKAWCDVLCRPRFA